MRKIPKEPDIIPIQRTRPGGRNNAPREYISGLQNRNTTNLLDLLGSAPPLDEEIIPESDDVRIFKNALLKTIKSYGRKIIDMTGVTGIPSEISNVLGRAEARLMNRLEAELRQYFMPLLAWSRQLIYEYEEDVRNNPLGSVIGGNVGGLIGGAIGGYFLGPTGAYLLGGFGQWVGSAFGAKIEELTKMDVDDLVKAIFGAWVGEPRPMEQDDVDIDYSYGMPQQTFTGRPKTFYSKKETYWKMVRMEELQAERLFY